MRGLQVARDRPEFRGGPGAVVRDHPRGFPRSGEHHVGGGRAARGEFRGQPHPAAVRGEPPVEPGGGGGGEAAPELLGRPAAKDAGGRRGVGGPEGEDGRGGAALEIAHVGGGPLLVGFRATHGDEDRARGGGRRHVAPLERGGVGAAEPALEEHRGERLVERAAAGGAGARFAAPARDAGAVGGGEDGGEAVGAQGRGLPPAPVGAVAPEASQHAVGLGAADGGPGQGGPEGDGGDHERGRGRRAALLEHNAEVGGQRGIGRRRGGAPGVELTQRTAVGRAGVGAQGMRGEAPGGRGGRGERPGRVAACPLGEGVRGPAVIRIMPYNGTYRSSFRLRCYPFTEGNTLTLSAPNITSWPSHSEQRKCARACAELWTATVLFTRTGFLSISLSPRIR